MKKNQPITKRQGYVKPVTTPPHNMAVEGVDYSITRKISSGHDESEFTANNSGSRVLSLKGEPVCVCGNIIGIKAYDKITKQDQFLTITFQTGGKIPEGFVAKQIISTCANETCNPVVASKHRIVRPIFIIFEKVEKQEKIGSPIKEIVHRRSLNITNIIGFVDGKVTIS